MGHHKRHTEEARAKMGATERRQYADGERIGQNAHQSGKTRCRNGHEYNDENTYVSPRGERVCRICRYDNLMRWKAKERERKAGDPPKVSTDTHGKGTKRTGQALENIRAGSRRRRAREQAEREAREAGQA
jgi:hypothetical protein